jgi:hypothetical protein
MSRLVFAELLKLRRRRTVLAWSAVVTVGLVIAIYAWTTQGGQYHLSRSLQALTLVGGVAPIMIGCAAGAGDRGAGVFRDLVATGRSRWALFAARVPAVLVIVIPLALAASLLAGLLATALTGPDASPSPGTIAQGCAWVAADFAVTGLLALGLASLLGSQATAVGVVLAWHLVASPLLMQVKSLGDGRWLVPLSALDRLQPAWTPAFPTMPIALSVGVLLAWAAGALAVGAWRTATADA